MPARVGASGRRVNIGKAGKLGVQSGGVEMNSGLRAIRDVLLHQLLACFHSRAIDSRRAIAKRVYCSKYKRAAP